MPPISAEEKLRRHRVNESVIGTNAMEGLKLDARMLQLMRQFEESSMTREELSVVIDAHVADLAARLSSERIRLMIGAA